MFWFVLKTITPGIVRLGACLRLLAVLVRLAVQYIHMVHESLLNCVELHGNKHFLTFQ